MKKWTQFMLTVYKDDNVLLFNTLNKAIVIVSKEDFENYNQGKIRIEDNSELCKEEFLIDANINEKSLFMEKLQHAWDNDESLIVVFLPTCDCNFKCQYCYQDGIIRKKYMDERGIDKIISYLDKYILNNKK